MSTSSIVAADGAATRSRLWTARTWPVIAGILVLMTFIAFESVSISTVLPVIVDDLGARAWYSLAFAATLTTALIGMIVGGDWADRSGITSPLAIGGGLFVTGLAVCAVAPDMAAFVVGRLLQGLGGGIDSVLLYVIVAKAIPQAAHARMFGLLTAAWILPSMVGPLVAGAFVEVAHWRVLFAVVGLGAGAALAILVVATRRHSTRADTRRVPVFGRRGWWAVATAAALLAVHVGGQRPVPQLYGWLGIGVVALIVAGARLLPGGTLRGRPGAPRLIALRAMLGAAVAATDVYLPLYLQQERGLRPALAGLVVAVGALGWAAGAWLQGRFAERAGSAVLLRWAAGLVLVGPIGAAFMIGGLVPIGAVAVSGVVMGAGMGLAYPVITSATLALAPPDLHGYYSSSLQAGESIAASAFLAFTGVVLTSIAGTGGYLTAYTLIGLTALLASLTGRRALHAV